MAEKVVLDFDPDTLTLKDFDDLEVHGGVTIADLFDENGRFQLRPLMRAKPLMTLVWIVKRRTDPTYTLEQASQVPASLVEMGGSSEDPVDPPTAVVDK